MTAIERARRMRERLHAGDIVAPIGQHFPKGVVMVLLPEKTAAVAWPDGSWWRHPINQLRKVV